MNKSSIFVILSSLFLLVRPLLIAATQPSLSETYDFYLIPLMVRYDVVFLYLALLFCSRKHIHDRNRLQSFFFYAALMLPMVIVIVWIWLFIQNSFFGYEYSFAPSDHIEMFLITSWLTIIGLSVSSPTILGIELLYNMPKLFVQRILIMSVLTLISTFTITNELLSSDIISLFGHSLPYVYLIISFLFQSLNKPIHK